MGRESIPEGDVPLEIPGLTPSRGAWMKSALSLPDAHAKQWPANPWAH